MATASRSLIVRPPFFEPRSLSTFYLQVFEASKLDGKAVKTKQMFRCAVREFERCVGGGRSIGSISLDDLDRYEQHLVARGLAKKTVGQRAWAITCVLNAADPQRFPTVKNRGLARIPRGAPPGTFEYEFATKVYPKLAERWGGQSISSFYCVVGRFTQWRGKFSPMAEMGEALIVEHETWAIESGHLSQRTVATLGQKLRMVLRMIDSRLCRERLKPYHSPPTVRTCGVDSKVTSLSQYAEDRYCVTRSLAPGSEYQLKHSVELFETWLAKTSVLPDLKTIDELLLSKWIKSLELLYTPASIKRMRGDVLGVLNDAADTGLRVTLRPRRIRCLKMPPPVANAWPKETIERIIMATRKLRGRLWKRVSAALYFEALFRCAWRLAIRKGDLFALRMSDIAADGRVWVVQRKTRTLTRGKLGPGELELLRTIGREQPLDWEYTPRNFYEWSTRVKELAGVDDKGHLQRFRKSAATDVAKRDRGAATKLLGHSTDWADPYYVDEKLLNEQHIEPSELNLPAKGGAE
jgi:integrase